MKDLFLRGKKPPTQAGIALCIRIPSVLFLPSASWGWLWVWGSRGWGECDDGNVTQEDTPLTSGLSFPLASGVPPGGSQHKNVGCIQSSRTPETGSGGTSEATSSQPTPA